MPRSRAVLATCAFSVAAPTVWNALPRDVRLSGIGIRPLDGRDYDITMVKVTVTSFQQTVTGFDVLPL